MTNKDKMTNFRWVICAMLFFATTVNYLDRQVLSLTWDEFIISLRQKTLSNVSRKVSFWNTKRYTKTAFTER